MKKLTILGLAAVAQLAFPAAADASIKATSGSAKGLSWQAQSRIVGMTSTDIVANGGNPIYLPSAAQSNGVVSLIMDYAGGSFICSGTLLPDRMSILTAAHCVSDGAGTANPLKTTAWFNGTGDDITVAFNPAATPIEVSQYFVNSGYTGEVIDQNDIAVLRLAEKAPDWATAFDLYTGNLTGEEFNVAGYGRRSDTGGAVGANLGTNRLRQGDNIYDYAWGNSAFGGFFTDRDGSGENFFGFAEIEYSYVSDFDSGSSANDAACLIAQAVGGGNGFCQTGVGAMEVAIAGGDSGGPGFINGMVSSVNSYGLSFGTGFGDYLAGLNTSWGEFSGYVPVYIHEDFIRSSMVPNGAVPEPATWAMLIMGFGLVGGAMRRQRQTSVSA